MKSTRGIPGRENKKIKKVSSEDIRNTGRIERIFTLTRYLREFRTVNQISTRLKIHRQSVHRYLNLLTQLGFEIEVLQNKRFQYRITNLNSYFNE